MTISANLNDTYKCENGEKKPIDIMTILHDIRTKFTDHVSRSDRANTLNIYSDTIKSIATILEANCLEVNDNIKDFLKNHSQNEKINFYSDEMNQTQNISYNSNKAQNLTKSQHYKDLLINSFNSLIEAIKCDYKANSYRNRRLPKNFQNFIGMGLIHFGANEEMRSLRDENSKDFNNIGLSEEESEYFNNLDDNEIDKRVKEFVAKLENKYGIKVLYHSIHNDEKTKHIHFTYSSYNFKEHKVFKSEMTKFKLKERGIEIQDLIYETFEDMDMPLYKNHKFSLNRGKQRTLSIKNKSMQEMQLAKIKDLENQVAYLEDKILNKDQTISSLENKISNYQNQIMQASEIKVEIDNEIEFKKNELIELDSLIDDMKSKKDQLDSELKELKTLRNTIKNDVSKTKDEKKLLYDEISKEQQKIRKLRKVFVDKQKKLSKFKEQILKDRNDIINKSYVKKMGFKVIDEDLLKKNITQKLSEYSKYKIKIQEVEDIKSKYNSLVNDFNNVNNQLKKTKSKVISLEELNDEKSHIIKEYKQKDQQEKSFTNAEVAKVTQKYENEVKELKNKSKLFEKKIEDLETSNNEFKDFIVDKNLSNDFKNYKEKSFNIDR